jgi:cysteine-rich repeat protein
MLRLTYSAAFLTLVFAACSNGDHNNDSPDAGGVVIDAPTGVCGDGVVDGNEQCDDGNAVTGDGCSASCMTELISKCGNGQLDGSEQCDDGNAASGDGCSADCSVESGYDCTGSPSTCTAIPPSCGDGMVNGTEECDDGNTADGDGCTAACQIETGFTCAGVTSVCTPLCGNGALDANEQCDGGAVANAYCSAACLLRWDVTEIPGNNDVTYRAQMLDPVDQVIEGSLPAADLDLYTFTLTAPSVVSFETYGDFAGGKLHCQATDTQLYLFANGTDVTTNAAAMMSNDDAEDDAPCSLLNGTLPAGTYFLKINLGSSTSSADQYLIDMHVAAQM